MFRLPHLTGARPPRSSENPRTFRTAGAARLVGEITLALTVALIVRSAPSRRRTGATERGQSTVEYALILLGAAAIALVVVAWVTRTDVIGRLFDTVMGRILRQAA